MRHRKFGKQMGRNTAHRRSLLRNLVTSLMLEERIETTVAKAKAARGPAERLITRGKRGDLHARRMAARYLTTPKAVKRLFDNLAQRYTTRSGGYTRVVRTGFRIGDGAEKAILELTEQTWKDANRVSEDLWKRVREHWSEPQCIEIVATITTYIMVSKFGDVLHVELEPVFDGIQPVLLDAAE